MKCVKFLVSAVAVNALTADDDDMNVMELRALSSNTTNTTTGGGASSGTSTPTTTTNTTNTTTGKTAGGTTGGKTSGGTTDGGATTGGKVVGGPTAETAAPPSGLVTRNVTNSTDTSVVEVTAEATFSAPNPFDAALQAAAAGRRRLASHATATTSLMKAYDMYCGALGLTTSKVICDSFTDAEKLDLFGDTTGNNCIISLKHPTGADQCSKTAAADTGDGACFYNGVAKDAAWGTYLPKHTVCTRDNGPGSSTYEYTSKSTVEMPAFIAANVDTTAVVAAANTEMSSTATKDFLSKAVIVAVAAIAANPMTATAVEANFGNFTAAFGVDKATFQALDSTLYGTGAFTVAEMDTAVTSSLVADLGSVVDLTAVSSQSTTATTGTSTESTAASLFAGSSVALAVMALLM